MKFWERWRSRYRTSSEKDCDKLFDRFVDVGFDYFGSHPFYEFPHDIKVGILRSAYQAMPDLKRIKLGIKLIDDYGELKTDMQFVAVEQ